jgi:hypothetical protein
MIGKAVDTVVGASLWMEPAMELVGYQGTGVGDGANEPLVGGDIEVREGSY